MPVVEIRTSVASADYAYQEGERVEVSGDRATELVQRGYAVLVRGEAPTVPERRVVAPETPEGRSAVDPARRRTRRPST